MEVTCGKKDEAMPVTRCTSYGCTKQTRMRGITPKDEPVCPRKSTFLGSSELVGLGQSQERKGSLSELDVVWALAHSNTWPTELIFSATVSLKAMDQRFLANGNAP